MTCNSIKCNKKGKRGPQPSPQLPPPTDRRRRRPVGGILYLRGVATGMARERSPPKKTSSSMESEGLSP
jgi:hypothetical protein